MQQSVNENDRVFFSIIRWPDGMSREQAASVIADASGMDRYSVQLRLGATPPSIVGLTPRDQAKLAIAALVSKGGDGFAVSFDDLRALGPTLKIRDLRIGGNGLEVDLWRGPTICINPHDIEIIVRAHMSEKAKRPMPNTFELPLRHIGTPAEYGLWNLGGAYGLAAAGLYGYSDADVVATTMQEIRLSHKLDLHTRDRKVYQIDGDKFGFQILGELRGHSDNQNIDAMCELMVTLNRDAIVDPYFALWSPPAAYERLRLPMMTVNNDDPAFAFYSRWTASMYRHILCGDSPAPHQ